MGQMLINNFADRTCLQTINQKATNNDIVTDEHMTEWTLATQFPSLSLDRLDTCLTAMPSIAPSTVV